jgi:hypothetical protein
MNQKNQEVQCCPKFDPAPWDDQINDWVDKKFVKATVSTFFYMPLNFGSVIKKLNEKADAAKAIMPDWLCLSDHLSKWKMNIYLAVDKDVPGAENVTLTGKFLSKVYEGDFKNSGKWCQDFEQYVKGRNYKVDQLYMWYTTCPKCAKKYGKNYVVIIARVEGL